MASVLSKVKKCKRATEEDSMACGIFSTALAEYGMPPSTKEAASAPTTTSLGEGRRAGRITNRRFIRRGPGRLATQGAFSMSGGAFQGNHEDQALGEEGRRGAR